MTPVLRKTIKPLAYPRRHPAIFCCPGKIKRLHQGTPGVIGSTFSFEGDSQRLQDIGIFVFGQLIGFLSQSDRFTPGPCGVDPFQVASSRARLSRAKIKSGFRARAFR